MNLFQRQIKVEQLSFELAHNKYKTQLQGLMKVGKADELAQSHRYILQWVKALESAIAEQQQIYVQQGSLDKNKIGFYIMSLPSEQIASICVIYMMRYLMQEFVNNTSKEADTIAQLRNEHDFQQSEVKMPAINLFIELGRLFDQQLKKRMTEQKAIKKKGEQLGPQPMEKHLLIDDQNITAMSKQMKVKVGAFLTNLMCKNLKFKVGSHEYLLLKPQVVKGSGNPGGSQKFIGFVSFNKGFIEDFIGELDKIHDLNLQMDRSVPMIYPPAPWKNFFFGGYYLK